MEIHKLHEMLTEAGIEHEFRDRTPPGVKHLIVDDLVENPTPIARIEWGWQVCICDPSGEPIFSAVEGFGTYGYGLDGEHDLIESWDFKNDPEGWLTAEEVFKRIKGIVNVRSN